MNKDTILEMLNSDSECLSLQEVYNILNEELEKSPEEMDTDLIELCMDAIESANSEKVKNKRVKMRVSKVLFAAAFFVVLIAISIPVCAKYFNINVPDGIVEFYDGCFNVDISNKEYVDDILVELEKNGIENAVLPNQLFLEDTKIYNLCSALNNGVDNLSFKFSSSIINGGITIQKYNNDFDFQDIQNKRATDFENVSTINKNNLRILIYLNKDYSYIEYYVDNNQYTISLVSCDYETAYKIANSI